MPGSVVPLAMFYRDTSPANLWLHLALARHQVQQKVGIK